MAATRKNYLPMQQGDVPVTFADVDSLTKSVGFELKPKLQRVSKIREMVYTRRRGPTR